MENKKEIVFGVLLVGILLGGSVFAMSGEPNRLDSQEEAYRLSVINKDRSQLLVDRLRVQLDEAQAQLDFDNVTETRNFCVLATIKDLENIEWSDPASPQRVKEECRGL